MPTPWICWTPGRLACGNVGYGRIPTQLSQYSCKPDIAHWCGMARADNGYQWAQDGPEWGGSGET